MHYRVRIIREDFHNVVSPILITSTPQTLHEELAQNRGRGRKAWLERSDDLGKTWTKCDDDGKPEGA